MTCNDALVTILSPFLFFLDWYNDEGFTLFGTFSFYDGENMSKLKNIKI